MSDFKLKIKAIIKNELGLHARPASLFVETTKKFKSKIQITKNGKTVDAKSIISVLTLGVEKGDEVEIICEGEDAEEACRAIKNLIEKLSELEKQ